MGDQRRTTLLHYAGAVLITALAVSLRWLLNPVLGDYLPFFALFGAVALTVWFSGYRAALLTAALGYIAYLWLFIEPRWGLGLGQPRQLIGLITYVLSCSLIISFGEAMRAARRRTQAQQRQLEQAVQEQGSLLQQLREEKERLQRSLRALEESESRYRTIGELIPFGVWMRDAGGEVLHLSACLLEMLGQTLKEHQEDWPSRVHPDDYERIVNGLPRWLQAGEPWEEEFRIRGSDGHYRSLLSRGIPLRGEDGQVRSWVGINLDLTARKRAEEALRQATEQLRIVTESMAAPVTRCSRDLTYLWVSKPYADWLQQPVSDILGRPIRDIIGPEAFAQLRPNFEKVLAGHVVRYEEEVQFHGIGPRWINAVYTPTMDGAGVPDGWVAVVLDITERRQMEEALRQSEQRFARFMHHLPGLAWIKDLEGRYLYANDTALKVFTGSRERLYGRTDDEVFPPETASQFKQNDRQALASEAGVQVIETLEHEDGLVHHSIVSKFPILGPEGEPALVGGMAIDITDHMRAEKVLAESEERFRQLAENVHEIFWMSDPETTELLYISPAYERVWGQSCQSLYDNPRSFMDAVHPDDQERVRIAVLENQARGEQTDKEYRVVRPDGSIRWVRDRAFPVKDAAGRFYRLVGIIDDFTEKKLAEEALKEADRRKDDFLATLAHELRNPLAPIRNAAEVFRRTDLADPRLRSVRDIIDRQVQQMVRLIDDLLDISRITRGKLQLRKERIELAAVLQSAVEASRPLIDKQSHELTVTLPEEPVYLDADPIRLAQVFSNLLNNAAKYTEKGGHVWLTAERQGATVVVSVRDTGIGIAAGHLPRLFEMFSQVAPALERSQGGLGIGLALGRGLVELHGGSVEARSAGLGKGSEFTVRLPVVEAVREARQDPGLGGAKSSGGPGCRILVADDLPDAVESLAMMLRLAGHEVQTAHDGLEAVQAAASFWPDVVFLDIGMPKMNGFEAARHIRQQPWGKEMLLVAVTGWGQEEDKRRTFEAGFNHHLTKPVEPKALEKLLARFQEAR
jgi:PAS domain S-box-containing protein